MECTKVNCPMQAGTKTDNCGKNCPWRTTVKTCDLILRTAAIEAFDDERVERNYGDVSPESVIRVIESIPAVDAAPVVHGWWEPSNDFNGYCRCSVCHDTYIEPDWLADGKWSFCPNCGAKMDGKQETR